MAYPGGWLSLEGMNPIPITNFISFAKLFDGTSTYTNGEIKDVTTFNTMAPAAGWTASPLSIPSEPYVSAVNSALMVNELYRANAMNMQTKMANLLSSVPIPMRNQIFCYGNINDDSLLYQMNIPLSFSAAVTAFQISLLENSVGSGNEHSKVQVIDFGAVSLSGSSNVLQIMFRGYFGPLSLGIKMTNTGPDISYMHEFKIMVMNSMSN